MGTTTTMPTDGVAIQDGLANLFIGVVNLFFNIFVVGFQYVFTSTFTSFFSGLFGLFQPAM